jgi:diguanylate cyclase (GGDEF)-like protein
MITLLALGYLPYSIDIRNAPVIGSLLEIILFSLLLAYHIHRFKEEKLAFQEQLIQQQQTERSRLFHTVAEKTLALRSAKEKLEKELEVKKKLEEELKHQAATDPLTGMMNRRALFDICIKEIGQASRYKHALSCLILDIDKFKNVNDIYGHDAGDIVLERIANLMQENIRSADYVGRIGGEEFAILMPSTDAESAYEIADRLRSHIEQNSIVANKQTIHITISIGISELHANETDTHDIMKRADDALYEAKETGRNRVCIHK